MPLRRWAECTWPECDMILAGQDLRRQKELVGHRIVAMLVHNTGYEKPVSEQQLFELPAIDKPGKRGASLPKEDRPVGEGMGYESPKQRASLIRIMKRVRPSVIEWEPLPGSPGALELEAARQEWAREDRAKADSAKAAPPVAHHTP